MRGIVAACPEMWFSSDISKVEEFSEIVSLVEKILRCQ
jgi:hypothetical protein